MPAAPGDAGPGAGEADADAVRIVAIGASAGGVEALRELIEAVPAEGAPAIVVAQHLAPNHLSMLANLLAPCTSLAVRTIVDGERPCPGAIHVAGPGHDVLLREGRLRLVAPLVPHSPHPAIDRLFLSLAAEAGERAMAIVLSGTGGDGAAGLRAIKAAGGVTLAQEPDSAKYAAMPRAAIQAGHVDLVLRPAQIGMALPRLVRGAAPTADVLGADAHEDAYGQIAQLVRVNTGFRLGAYKPATIRRRIARRMSILGLDTIAAYVTRLHADRAEADALVRDTFISVTGFFRDEAAFRVLAGAIDRRVAALAPAGVLRCWVPACATGEEAYSIAMLLQAALERRGMVDVEFIVFASDVDEPALETARAGQYPASAIEGMPPAWRDRYIELANGTATVIKALRSRVVFARQNVLDDPPFARLDFISCRNLLIYLNPPVQQQMLRMFHFALREGGLLFLGKAEHAETEPGMFRVEDASARIYVRLGGAGTLALAPGPLRVDGRRRPGLLAPRAGETMRTRAQEALARRFAPPGLIINEDDRVVHFHGDLAPFLSFPQDTAGWSVFDLLRGGARAEMRALIYRCRREGHEVTGRPWPVSIDGTPRAAMPLVARVDPDSRDLLMIAFVLADAAAGPAVADGGGDDGGPGGAAPAGPLAGAPVAAGPVTGSPIAASPIAASPISASPITASSITGGLVVRELERELATTKAHLSVVVEALETSNEELQSLNEELQSTNEELQTANEELQTSNEELLTVNEELQVKSSELECVATDLINVRESLSFPLIVVDTRLNVTGANRACATIAQSATLAEGQSLNAVAWTIPAEGLSVAAEAVITGGQSRSQMIAGGDGRHHQLTIMPYRTAQDAIGGALLLFEDVTAREAALAARAESEGNFRNAMNSAPIGMWMRRLDGEVVSVNPQLQTMLGLAEADIRARGSESFIAPDERQRFNDGRQQVLDGRRDRFVTDVRMLRGDGTMFWANVSSSLIRGPDGTPTGTISQIQDIDRSRRDRLRIEDLVAKMRLATENGGIGIWERQLPGDLLFWDAGMCDLYGVRDTDAAIDIAWWQSRIHDEDRPAVAAAVERTRGEGTPLEVEYRIHRTDGSIRHLVARGRRIDGEGGAPARLIGTCIDVTELRVMADRLAAENRALAVAIHENAARGAENRLLVEASAHGVIAVDEAGIIRSVNAAAEALFGHEEDDLVGRAIEVLIPASLRMGHVMMRSDVDLPATGVYMMARNREVLGLHRDGSTIPIDVQLRRSASTTDPGVVASIFDLRPRIAQERAMQQARDAAEAANRAKSTFIATMSHEIRTPMNVVFGMLELLGRGELGEAQRGYLAKAQVATRNLRQIIDDVLDFSRIEARRLSLESAPFSLPDLINAVAEQVAATMAEGRRALDLVVDLDPGLPALVIGDALRLQQVLLNLGANAVKFTPAGTVTLSVRIVPRRPGAGRGGPAEIEFAVADTGIGIAADKISAIFESFTQAEASTTRRFGGSGLGLSISQRLVQLMGGEIAVDSTPGAGSRFAFTLALPEARGDAAGPAGGEGLRGLRVLVIDAAASSREVLAAMAGDLGWQVTVAADAAAALAAIRAGFDLVLVGWRLADRDGWSLGERLRPLAGEAAIVVLLSAFEMADYRARLLVQASPFDGYLNKPATLAVLLRLATAVLAERAEARRGQPQTASAAPPAPDPAPATGGPAGRLQGLRILVAEDFVLNQELLRSLLEMEGAIVTLADDGRAAVRAVSEGPGAFDIVLMDIQMPEMDGFEATRALRRDPAGRDLPVLAITANAQQSDRDRCLAAGMDDYLAKPIAIEDLVAKVIRWTTARTPGTVAAAPAADRAARDMPPAATLLDLMTFDHAAGVLARSAQGIAGPIAAIAALIEAIAAAVAAGDGAAVRRASHTLAGAAGGLGAGPLTEAARAVARGGGGADAAEDAMPGGTAPLLTLAAATLTAMRARAAR